MDYLINLVIYTMYIAFLFHCIIIYIAYWIDIGVPDDKTTFKVTPLTKFIDG